MARQGVPIDRGRETPPWWGMTREELKALEAPIFDFARARIPEQRAAPDTSPYVAAIMNLTPGLTWLAIHRELDGAKDFLDATGFFVAKDIQECRPSARTAAELHDCFSSHMRGFWVRSLTAPDEGGWELFEAGTELLARAIALSPFEKQARSVTPLTLHAAGLAALAALHGRPFPEPLRRAAGEARVKVRYRRLRDALVGVADDPVRERCDDVLNAYRAAVSLADYRPPHVRELSFEELLPISAVAQGGDILEGAFNIFE